MIFIQQLFKDRFDRLNKIVEQKKKKEIDGKRSRCDLFTIII